MRLIASLLLALPLTACAGGTALNPTATNDVTTALGLACPIYASIVKKPPAMDTAEKNAFDVLAAICPPNPPPTTATATVADIIAAYEILDGI